MKLRLPLFIRIAFVLLAIQSVWSQPKTTVKVIGITDGDTVTVLDSKKQQLKVRLAGIDAPEKNQDFGAKSKLNLSELAFGKTVTLISRKVDRYGRLVGKLLLDDRDLNLEQVRAGLAWHFKEYANEQSVEDRKLYTDAEKSARKSKLKIWSVADPVPPWNFRKAGRSSAAPIIGPRTVYTNSAPSSAPVGAIIGNRKSMIFHTPGCHSYSKVAEKNRVYFSSRKAAEAAGYRAARNC